MSIFRGLLVAGAVSFAAMSANAADMYRAPEGVSYKDGPVYEPSWAGAYVGVNGGYGWSANDSTLSASELRCRQVGNCVTLESITKPFKTDGGFGGGQIGYNWQPLGSNGYKDGPAPGHIVLGVEADIQGAGIEGSAAFDSFATGKTQLDWFGTVRGRLGYAWGPTLAYFTGGFAFGGVKDTLTLGPTTLSKSSTETGYVVGGGIEHLFNPRWSVKVEYQYIDLGSDKLSAIEPVDPPLYSAAALNAEHTYHTVRLGLNYHILPGYEPLK